MTVSEGSDTEDREVSFEDQPSVLLNCVGEVVCGLVRTKHVEFETESKSEDTEATEDDGWEESKVIHINGKRKIPLLRNLTQYQICSNRYDTLLVHRAFVEEKLLSHRRGIIFDKMQNISVQRRVVRDYLSIQSSLRQVLRELEDLRRQMKSYLLSSF